MPIVSDNRAVAKNVTCTFASTNNNAESTVTLTVPGVLPGMPCTVNFSAQLEAGIFVCEPPVISAVDTVLIRIRNVSGGTLVPAAVTAYVCAG